MITNFFKRHKFGADFAIPPPGLSQYILFFLLCTSMLLYVSGFDPIYCREVKSIVIRSTETIEESTNYLLVAIIIVMEALGALTTGLAIFMYLEAYSEENSSGMSKALQKFAMGLAFLSAPVLIKILIG